MVWLHKTKIWRKSKTILHEKSTEKQVSYSDIEKNVETRFETSNYQLHRPFPKGKN